MKLQPKYGVFSDMRSLLIYSVMSTNNRSVFLFIYQTDVIFDSAEIVNPVILFYPLIFTAITDQTSNQIGPWCNVTVLM